MALEAELQRNDPKRNTFIHRHKRISRIFKLLPDLKNSPPKVEKRPIIGSLKENEISKISKISNRKSMPEMNLGVSTETEQWFFLPPKEESKVKMSSGEEISLKEFVDCILNSAFEEFDQKGYENVENSLSMLQKPNYE